MAQRPGKHRPFPQTEIPRHHLRRNFSCGMNEFFLSISQPVARWIIRQSGFDFFGYGGGHE